MSGSVRSKKSNTRFAETKPSPTRSFGLELPSNIKVFKSSCLWNLKFGFVLTVLFITIVLGEFKVGQFLRRKVFFCLLLGVALSVKVANHFNSDDKTVSRSNIKQFLKIVSAIEADDEADDENDELMRKVDRTNNHQASDSVCCTRVRIVSSKVTARKWPQLLGVYRQLTPGHNMVMSKYQHPIYKYVRESSKKRKNFF